MTHPLRRFATGAFAALVMAAPALAATPVTLNANLTDATGHVTLGELFDDAGPARDVVVAERTGPSVVLDAAAVQALARRYGLEWDNPQGIRRIIVRADAGGMAAAHGREVLSYAHSLITGQIVQPDDLIWAKASSAPVDAAPSVDAVVGMAARRPLREGDAVLDRDVTAPIVIKAGDTVSVTYADAGVTLTLQGRAMANAAAGETLNIQNTASKKLIEAVATGPDQAVVGPEALRLKEQRASQFALR
ncbi:MAG TPA: flagellar basal body P-ring formation chaperone FlgA [Caulobacteraceae bacterium]|nr:flagellar basal body P-ring formation chaperone FlgA [Caulobacteraceae bacterium]